MLQNMTKKYNNFVEAKTVEEANEVDLTIYTLIKDDEKRGVYVFKLRAKGIE